MQGPCNILSQISHAVPKLRNGDAPQCALDYILKREVKAADKVGRPPVLDDPASATEYTAIS